MMTELFSSKMASFEESLSTSTPKGNIDTTVLASEFSTFKSFIWKAVSGLKAQMELVFNTLDGLEMKSRANILLLHGLPENKVENIPALIANVCSEKLGLQEVSAQSFDACIRLGQKRDSEKPRPVLLRFHNLHCRSQVWAAKKKLKGSGLTLSEFLTSARHSVFVEARKAVGVSRSWTSDGKIVVVDSDGNRRRITSMTELRALLGSKTVSGQPLDCPTQQASAAMTSSSAVRSSNTQPDRGYVSKPRNAKTVPKK